MRAAGRQPATGGALNLARNVANARIAVARTQSEEREMREQLSHDIKEPATGAQVEATGSLEASTVLSDEIDLAAFAASHDVKPGSAPGAAMA